MTRKKRRNGQCAYCGLVGPMTRDHIPPQNLFSQPLPSDLITVPACRQCNKAFDLDDEYFRLAVTTGMDKEAFPKEFDLSIQAIHRLKEPGKIKFAKRMLVSCGKKPVYTPAGLYLGHAPALEIEAARVARTVSRTIRGLFFHHSKRRLPNASHIEVWSQWFSRSSSLDPETMVAWKEIFEALCTQPVHVVGKGVFRYRYLMNDEVPSGSAWWLSFYQHRNFIGATFGLQDEVA